METCQRNGLPKKRTLLGKIIKHLGHVDTSGSHLHLGDVCWDRCAILLYKHLSIHLKVPVTIKTPDNVSILKLPSSANNYIGIHLIISEIFLDQTGFAVSHPSHLEDKLKPGQESSLGEISPHSQWRAPLCKPLGFSPHKFSSSDAWAVAQSNFKC